MIPIRDDNPSVSTPWVTYTLIGINTLVFLVQVGMPQEDMMTLVKALGFVPMRATAALQGEAGLVAGFGTAFTSMFMHGGWLHLIGNMWYLYIFGDNVEDGLGHGRFVAFYLACGFFATGSQYLIGPFSPAPIVGASGAIAGVLGAYLVVWPRARIVTLLPIFFLITFVHLPALVVLGFWFIMQFFQGVATVGASSGVAYWAHIGGFALGAGLIKILPFRHSPAGRRRSRFPRDKRYWR